MIPFLRWAGSKRKLVPDLEPFWASATGKYIEPFMGSACLFFSIEPQAAILGDTNNDLVETFKTVRDNPRAVHNHLRVLRRNEIAYYKIRDEWPHCETSARRAARFIYLNRLCF